MKLIQISDLHLVQPGQLLAGLDPLQRLRDCIADINAHHADADYVAITGDLADAGERAGYEALRHELEALLPPYGLTLGNHDRRDIFLEVFPDHAGPDGYVQKTFDLPDGRLVLLDTLETGEVGGWLGAARLAWLDRALGDADAPVFVFMHHPPVDVGMPGIDGIKLGDAEAFFDIAVRHGNVRHIFAGHVHRLISGTYRSIPYSILRSTNHQTDLDLSDGQMANTHEAPLYAVILADGLRTIVHARDFTDRTRFYS